MDDGDSGEFSTIFSSEHETRVLVTEGIERGRYYRFRYRVKNVIGYSAYSEVAYIQAVDIPETPARPKFLSATDTTITISIIESVDSRGVDVTSYAIFIDAGDDLTSAFTEIADYDGVAATYTIDADDGLGAPGTLYRLKVLAKNEWDISSAFSEELVVALGSVPAAPATPVKVIAASAANEIAVDWPENAAETLPIYGYRLYSDFGLDDEFSLVFDGLNQPTITQFLVTDVPSPLLTYKLYVTAINFNGEGPASSTAALRSCTLPSVGETGFPATVLESITATAITISWRPPVDNGGCSILGFAIYLDDADGVFSEYDSANVRGKPFLSSYSIDMSAKTIGETYLIKLGAENVIGEVQSNTVSVLLASVPDTPSIPTKNLLNETHQEIVMSAPASDGGDMIRSYELQVKGTAEGAEWETVAGANGTRNLDLLFAIPIEAYGQLLWARYRCANEIGWGEFSEASHLRLALRPSRPPAPLYVSSDATSISIEVLPSEDNGGAAIDAHEVWLETGGVEAEDTSYDGLSRFHTLSGLTSGAVYRISIRSLNAEGYSEFSELLEKAATNLPAAPSTVTKNIELSTESSIYLQWDKVADEEVETTGYLLWMASNPIGSEEWVLAMNATSRPESNQFSVDGLEPGEIYKFKLQTLNFNGASQNSSILSFNACLPPSGLIAPWRTGSSTASISLRWAEPLNDGGCPITGYAVFRDDGLQSEPTIEVNSAQDPAVRGIPTLRDLVVTDLPAGREGEFVRFSVRAYNREGFVDSASYSAVLHAAVPVTPPSPPELETIGSNSTQMTIALPELVGAETGNSDIQAYSLEVDDGQAGDFVAFGSPSMSLEIVVPATRGLAYRLRYRARNSVGWGGYSPELSALAAEPPSPPAAPIYVSATGSSITLAFTESEDDGGARISGYELWSSDEPEAANRLFTQVAGYTDNAMGYTLTVADDGLVAGEVYAFKLGAVNSKGQGELSDDILVAVAADIAKPSAPTRNLPLTTKTSIFVEWA